VDFEDLEPLVRLKRLGPAKVYVGRMAGWPKGDLKEGARWMLRALRSGLDGGFFWDTQGHFDPIWDRMRRFGSIEYLEDLLAGRLPPVRMRDTLRIHDLTVDRYNPWNAY